MKTNIKVISVMIALLAVLSYGRIKALNTLNMSRTLYFQIESTEHLLNNFTNLVCLYTSSTQYDTVFKVRGTQSGIQYNYTKARVDVYQNFNGFTEDGIVDITLKSDKWHFSNSYSGEAYY